MMDQQTYNLLIIDADPLVVAGLKTYLNQKFGNQLFISTFVTAETALAQINKNTHMVVLDFHLGNKKGNKALKSIIKANPKTEVIMLSSNENIGLAIESFRNTSGDYLVNRGKVRDRVIRDVYKIVTYPVQFISRELRISKLLAMILLSFIFVALGSFVFYNLF